MNQSISILTSSISNGPYTNLGGKPSVPLDDGANINGMFHWDSIHGGEVFSVIYVKNSNYTQSASDVSAAIDVKIKKDLIRDIVMQKYLEYLSINVFIPSYVTKNYEHPPITPDGYFIDSYPKRITDFISSDLLNRSIIFLKESLDPGEFIPVIIKLKLTGPMGVIFKLPIAINTYVGVF